MASRKHQKTELIAIYRLEFYKKQKNWKLSGEARKDKELRNSSIAPEKNKHILNETYNIETKEDNNASVFNDAFLKDESDGNVPVSSTICRSLHTQLLEPINACQECQHTNIKPQNPWSDYVDDGWIGGSNMVEKCSGDGNEFEGFHDWVNGMVWTNSSIPQLGWNGDVPASMNILQVEQCPEQLEWAADDMLCHQLDKLDRLTPWPDDQKWVADIWEEHDLLAEFLESVDEFMIGAHIAPHSSEMELCVPPVDGGELNVSQASLSRMSGSALSAAVRRHTSSLRRLLQEAGQRRTHQNSLPLDMSPPDYFRLGPRDFFSTDYSYEAFPTRDIPSTSPVSAFHCQHTFTQQTHLNPCKNGFTPLSSLNFYKDGITSQPPTKLCKNDSTPQPSENVCNVGCTPQSPSNFLKDDYIRLQPANQCRNTSTAVSAANLYRDGFLAGSYRNKVPLGFIGRGRGRLQEGGGMDG